MQQQAMREHTGAMFVVTHTAVHYRMPARLDDELEVTVAVRHTGRASLEVVQQAWRKAPGAQLPADTLLAEGEVRIGCVDVDSLRPCRIPAQVLELLP